MTNILDTRAPLPIVFAADGNFSIPLAIAVESLLRNAHPNTLYDIHILDDGVLLFAKQHIDSLRVQYNFHITYHPVAALLEGLPTTHYFPRVSFARFLIPDLLPETCGSRIFYSDADVLIQDDLSPLFEMDMAGFPLAAIQEMAVLAENGQRHLKRWAKRFSLPIDEAVYCNSGNLLFDREKWSRMSLGQSILKMAGTEAGSGTQMPDQDIMNAVCQGHIALMPLRYCVIPMYASIYTEQNHSNEFSKPCRYGPQEMQQAACHPAIIHFAGQKPRVLDGARYPLEQQFIDFWKQSAWRGYMPYSPRIGSLSPSRFIQPNTPIKQYIGELRKQLIKYTVASYLFTGERRQRYAMQRDGLRTVLRNAKACC